MDIFIIQHSRTRQFHVPDAGVVTDTLPAAVKAMADRGVDATQFQSHDDRIVDIPTSVRPLAPSRQEQ